MHTFWAVLWRVVFYPLAVLILVGSCVTVTLYMITFFIFIWDGPDPLLESIPDPEYRLYAALFLALAFFLVALGTGLGIFATVVRFWFKDWFSDK